MKEDVKEKVHSLVNDSVKRKAVKVFAAIVLMVLVTMLAACSSNGGTKGADTEATPSPSSPSSSNETNSGADAAPQKITIAIPANPNVEDFKTNYFTTMIEEAMNVELEFLELPSKGDEAKTKLALMVSSGQKLPDVINMGMDSVTAYDYATKGIFLKLDDYFSNPDIAVNFNKIPEPDRSYMYNNSKLSDGSVYAVPRYIPQQWNEGGNRMWINKEWLSKLDLQAPTTTDELYDVLKAFVEQDPNGNQKKDEIGMLGSKDGWAQNPIDFLMNAFIEANPGKSYFSLKDGEIIASFAQPEWKEGLEYIHKLIKDGLLSPLTFTQDQTQMRAIINVKGGMAGVVPSGSYSAFDRVELDNQMDLLAPLKGPSGFVSTPQNPTQADRIWFITKDSQNPELAFKVADYLYSLEPSISSRFGEKGVDWTDDPAITSQYLGKLEESDGIQTGIAVMNPQIWNNLQNKHWNDSNPGYRSADLANTSSSVNKAEPNPNAAPSFDAAFAKQYAINFPKEVISQLNYTPEELKEIANSKTAIDAYVTQSAVAFVTGNKPLSQWDSYLSELNKMGLEAYIATTQAAYDRTK